MKCINCGAEIEADSSFCVVCGKPVAPSRQVRIGRDAENDIVVNHERISRLHAVITREGSQYRITDQNSLNGILVNGRKVSSALVRPGDRVSLGGIADLDWNAVEAAFSGTPSGTYTSARQAPVFYQQEAPRRKKFPPALLISLIVLGVAGLLTGAYFLFGEDILAGSGETYNIQTEYTYSIKSVEEREMSNRRSELETLEDLLVKAPAVLGIEQSLALAYCLLDVKVGEPQTMQSAGGEAGKILRTASTAITEKEFKARYEYLQDKPEHLARIQEAEASLAQRKNELRLAEVQLELASKAPEAKGFVNDVVDLLKGPANSGQKSPLDSLKSDEAIDSSVDQALSVYDEALGNLEGVYDSLNYIKSEVAAVKTDSAKKGGRVLK